MSSTDAATHAAADLTNALLNPTPNIPLTTLGKNQTSDLKQIFEVLNMADPTQVKLPTNESPQKQKPPKPLPRVNSPEETPEAAPATPPRVDPQGDTTFQPGRAPIRPPKSASHIIPNDM